MQGIRIFYGHLMVRSAWLLVTIPIGLFIYYVVQRSELAETILGLWILFGAIPTGALVTILLITGRSLSRPPASNVLAGRNLPTVFLATAAVLVAYGLLTAMKAARDSDGTLFVLGAAQHVLAFLIDPLTLGGAVIIGIGAFLARL